MKNFSKILCVVLALVIALSAASCSFTKQYAYNKDGVKLPIGVYICYLYSAYKEAEQYAQQSDSYDSATGKYNGKTSFLKIKITDDEDTTEVAEKWIKDKAIKDTKRAVAVNKKYVQLKCTMDEAAADSAKELYQSQWEQYEEELGGYGISFDSFFMLVYTLPSMESEVFKAEYAADGPSAVSDDELASYFKKNYTAYKTLTVNLYDSTQVDSADGSEETTTENTPFSEKKIAKYQKSFSEYASTLSKGGSYDTVIKKYMKEYGVEEDPTQTNVEFTKDFADDEIHNALKDMKEGQAMTLEVGTDETNKQLILVYREPIENQVEAYTDRENEGLTVLHKMKDDAFDKLIEGMMKKITLNSACNSYKPSMFEGEAN